MVKRALIYARESKYDARQANRSPEEQVEAGAAWCEAEGYDVAEVITEAGIGASRHSRGERAGWRRAKDLIATGAVDILVTWASSRATRQLGEYVELRDLCAEHGVLWASKGRIADLTRADDRLATGVQAVVDDHQAEVIREDVCRAIRANVVNGLPHGREAYGFRWIHDTATGAFLGQEPHPDEAPIVRRIYAEYLSGRSQRSIVEGLRAGGIRTKRGSPWHRSTIKGILTNPVYIGLRRHHGEQFAGRWEPIIDIETWELTQQRITSQVAVKRRQSPRAWLLTGVTRCGRCGEKLHGSTVTGPRGTGKRVYICEKRCAARNHDKLDAWVTAAVIKRLSLPDVGELLSGREDPRVNAARSRVDELRAKLDDAMARWKVNELSVQAYAEMEAHLLPQIAEAERAVRAAAVPIDVDVPAAEAVPGWWDGLAHEIRREVVHALIVAVVVQPVGKGRRKIDWPGTTSIEWRR